MARSRNVSVEPPQSAPFDWLKDYDRRARDLTQAKDWTDHSFFALARFPRLQPVSTRRSSAAGREWFSNEITSWKIRIDQHPKAKRVLTNLSDDQRTQVAALISDTIENLEIFVSRRRKKKQFGKLAKGGESWTRMLQSKYRTACNVLEDLSAYCRKRDSIISSEYRRRAAAALKELCPSHPPRKPNPPFTPTKDAAAIARDLGAITDDPTIEGMVQLYWFFRSECKLPGHDSEVRTALIRNAFWSRLGVRKVDCRENYQPGESRGSDAVKQAVRRFRPH